MDLGGELELQRVGLMRIREVCILALCIIVFIQVVIPVDSEPIQQVSRFERNHQQQNRHHHLRQRASQSEIPRRVAMRPVRGQLRARDSGPFVNDNSTQRKRFKSNVDDIRGQASTGSPSQVISANYRANNSSDINNNLINTNEQANASKAQVLVSNEGQNGNQTWCRNVNSINGTIDLSQYKANDVDRLYGDALLVYFKNFNE